jgi:hypothetical protein
VESSQHKLVPETRYRLTQEVFGEGLYGTPNQHLPVGTEFHVLPYKEDSDIVAKVKKAGLRGDFYEVFLGGDTIRANYPRYKVIAEKLEQSIWLDTG